MLWLGFGPESGSTFKSVLWLCQVKLKRLGVAVLQLSTSNYAGRLGLAASDYIERSADITSGKVIYVEDDLEVLGFWSLPYGLLAFFFPRSPMDSGRGLNEVFPLYSRWCLSTFLSRKRMLLSSFFACAFSPVLILFSFLAVAVNSNSIMAHFIYRWQWLTRKALQGFGTVTGKKLRKYQRFSVQKWPCYLQCFVPSTFSWH